MMSYVGYVEIAIETILIFGAFFVIGSFLRVQVMGGHTIKRDLLRHCCTGWRLDGSTFRSRRNREA